MKLQDIAQIEIKQHYDTISHINGEEGTGLIIMKEPSKNAVAIGKEIDKKVKEIDKEYKDQFSIKLLASTHEQVENAVTSMGKRSNTWSNRCNSNYLNLFYVTSEQHSSLLSVFHYPFY